MRISSVALLSVLAVAASAQNLYVQGTTYTGTNDYQDNAVTAKTDALGNVFLLTSRQYGLHNRVTKYSAAGSLLWSTEIPSSTYESVVGMALDSHGNPVVVGSGGGLLLAKFDGANGTVNVFRKTNPFNVARGISGAAVAIDPADDTILVGGAIERGSDPDSTVRPLLAKFSNDGATQIWISAPTNVRASLSRIVVDHGRIYFGGTVYDGSSVYVGYLPTTGGTPQFAIPTAKNATYRALIQIAVMNGRLIWTATDYDWGGPNGDRLQWGQQDYSADGGGGGSVFTESEFTRSRFTGIAVDPDTGEIAMQQSNWGAPASVRFMEVDPATDGFIETGSCTTIGDPFGIVPLGKGYYGAFERESFAIGEQYWINVVRRSSGWISGTPYKGANTTYTVSEPSVDGNLAIFARGTRSGASTARFVFASGPTNDTIRMDEDAIYKGNVVRNDIGIGTKTVGSYTAPAHAAQFSLTSSGNLTYKPLPNWFGTDTFTYEQLIDGATYRTRTVTITVRNTPDAPTAVDDNVGEVDGHGTSYLGLMSNDLNPDDPVHPLRYLSVTQPSNGVVSLANNKTVLKIKPYPWAAGQPFTFAYTVQNGSGQTSTAVVTGSFGL